MPKHPQVILSFDHANRWNTIAQYLKLPYQLRLAYIKNPGENVYELIDSTPQPVIGGFMPNSRSWIGNEADARVLSISSNQAAEIAASVLETNREAWRQTVIANIRNAVVLSDVKAWERAAVLAGITEIDGAALALFVNQLAWRKFNNVRCPICVGYVWPITCERCSSTGYVPAKEIREASPPKPAEMPRLNEGHYRFPVGYKNPDSTPSSTPATVFPAGIRHSMHFVGVH